MTNKTNTVEEKLIDLLGIESYNRTNHADTCECYPCSIVPKVLSLFNQYADSRFKRALPEKKEVLFGEDHKVKNLNMVNPVFAVIFWKHQVKGDLASITSIVENELISREITEWSKLNSVTDFISKVFDARVYKWSDVGEKYGAYEKPVWTSRRSAENDLIDEIKSRWEEESK